MPTTIGHNLQPMVHGTTTQKEHDTSTQTNMTHDSISHMYIFYKCIFLNYKERYWVYEYIQLPGKKPEQFVVIQAQRAAIQSQSLATVMATPIESKACKSGPSSMAMSFKDSRNSTYTHPLNFILLIEALNNLYFNI